MRVYGGGRDERPTVGKENANRRPFDWFDVAHHRSFDKLRINMLRTSINRGEIATNKHEKERIPKA